MGPISWSHIADYAQAHGFDDDETGDLFTFVRAMDAAYVSHYNKRERK